MEQEKDYLAHLLPCFARRLRQAREAANLTQDVLSDRAQIGQGMISSYEQGRRLPSLPTLCRMAVELGVPLTYFFEDDAAGSLNDDQRDALRLLDTLSPLALDYVVIFVRHVNIMQHQRRFLESEAFDASSTDARLLRLLARDLDELEMELARQGDNSPHVSVRTLVAFTALALLGMELKVDTVPATKLSRRFARHLREACDT